GNDRGVRARAARGGDPARRCAAGRVGGAMGILDVDHAREIWNALRGNKLRTVLTAFGVFWGIFLLMVMMGSGNGLETGAMQDFAGQAHNSVFMWGQRTSKPYKGFPVGRGIELTNEDVDAVR